MYSVEAIRVIISNASEMAYEIGISHLSEAQHYSYSYLDFAVLDYSNRVGVAISTSTLKMRGTITEGQVINSQIALRRIM